MHVCACRNCHSTSGEGISMFRFPKELDRAMMWLEVCNRTDLVPKIGKLYYNYKLCELHFEKSCFSRTATERKTLMPNAFPTIFSHKIKKVNILSVVDIPSSSGMAEIPSTSAVMKPKTNIATPAAALPHSTSETADQKSIQPTNPASAPKITTDVIYCNETTDQSFCDLTQSDPLSDDDSPSISAQDTTADVVEITQIEESALRCRVCWEEKNREILILVSNLWPEQSTQTIRDIILICVPTMSIQDNDYICTVCFWELKYAYKFIDRCVKTETLLFQQTTNDSKSLANILEKSVEKGNKIQIILENPQSIEGGYADHDHTYVRPINEGSVENEIIKQEIEIHPHPLDDYDDDNNSNDISTETVADCDSTGNTNKIFAPQNIPQVLVDLLDFAPLNVRAVTINKEMCGEHREGLLEEGVNIVDLSRNSKKKRVIYLTRDVLFCPTRCEKCNLQFRTRTELADHKHLHRKGKIKVSGEVAFPCTICGGEFTCDRDYRQHCIRFHNERRPYQCKKCSRKFCTFKEFKEHATDFKSENGKCTLPCKKCNKQFFSRKQLKLHEADVADAPCCDYFKCKICSEKFTREGFKEHCEVHPNYPCSFCGKSLTSANGLHTHEKNVHKSKPGMCHECGKILKTPKMLQHHIEVIHGENKYICDKCPREFKSKIYLWRHQRFVHAKNKVKNFSCEKCGKMFTHRNLLKQHIDVVHIAKVKYHCSKCGEGFVRKDYLTRHVAFHEKYKEFTCSVCNRSFLTESTLLQHQNAGHDENGQPFDKGRRKSGRPFASRVTPGLKKKYGIPCVCNICYKVLANQATLKLHYKAHLKIREYTCEKCEITLQTYSAYKNHLKRHENPKFELSCNICHAYRPTQEELEAHKRKVHTNMKYQCKYCPAKFGRKHLLFSHESIKHSEVNAKKEELYKLLSSHTAFASPSRWVSKTNKGMKLGPFLDDVDQVIDRLAGRSKELREYVQEDPIEDNFDILSEEYEMREEVVACQAIKDCMEQ